MTNIKELNEEELNKVTGGDVDPEKLAAMDRVAQRAKEKVLYLQNIGASHDEIQAAQQALCDINAQISAYISGTTYNPPRQ